MKKILKDLSQNQLKVVVGGTGVVVNGPSPKPEKP